MKIMAIHEYSDSVFEAMKKTHDEVVFLYSMLNDKHAELTSLTGELQRLAADVRDIQNRAIGKAEPETPAAPPQQAAKPQTHSGKTGSAADIQKNLELVQQARNTVAVPAAVQQAEESAEKKAAVAKKPAVEELAEGNHNDEILKLFKEGYSPVDIARKLGLGIGEVNLVIGLYRGERKQ